MSYLSMIITELGIVLGALIPAIVVVKRLINGIRCSLRRDMLEIYYRCRDKEEIRQYDFENFMFLYEAYKSLKGNSFIDKIHKEIMTWQVIN